MINYHRINEVLQCILRIRCRISIQCPTRDTLYLVAFCFTSSIVEYTCEVINPVVASGIVPDNLPDITTEEIGDGQIVYTGLAMLTEAGAPITELAINLPGESTVAGEVVMVGA